MTHGKIGKPGSEIQDSQQKTNKFLAKQTHKWTQATEAEFNHFTLTSIQIFILSVRGSQLVSLRRYDTGRIGILIYALLIARQIRIGLLLFLIASCSRTDYANPVHNEDDQSKLNANVLSGILSQPKISITMGKNTARHTVMAKIAPFFGFLGSLKPGELG
ncbi:hypothetical protein D915_006716 [Fasciola hepatica]|uniref:Uncharacterized protein n=1 Tax=Fasciola hepatica TaxID=6192 RepID=A0A4E0RWU6_FASHE|nr:hypothetical protein D915_006716 [Fasciola hepatica]